MRLFLLFFLFCFLVKAQDKTFAFKVIKDLTSTEMFGRGYIHNGHNKAADYIENEFKSIGLNTLTEEGYQQHFSFSLNQIIGHPTISFHNKEWELGVDYIIDPSSPSKKGSFETIVLDQKTIIKEKKIKKLMRKGWDNKALIIDVRGADKKCMQNVNWIKYADHNAALVIVINDQKLTAHMSQETGKRPIFEFKVEGDFTYPKEVSIELESKFYSQYRSQNVLGFVPGTEFPDSFVFVTGHYDHLGGMGEDVYFPGANDNASGIAFLLNMAKTIKASPVKYSVVFMAFGAEEVGLIGSKYFVDNPLVPLEQIKMVLNFDILGTGDEGIKMVNATNNMFIYDKMVALNDSLSLLTKVGKRGPAANSDHHFFYKAGVPAVFIYTLGGISAYHDVLDRSETLPLTKYNELFILIHRYLEEL